MATCKFCEMEFLGFGCLNQKQANTCNNYRQRVIDNHYPGEEIPPDTPSLQDTMPLEYFTESGDAEERCDHIAEVSISETEIQCIDCLRVSPKYTGFKSDFPERDRG